MLLVYVIHINYIYVGISSTHPNIAFTTEFTESMLEMLVLRIETYELETAMNGMAFKSCLMQIGQKVIFFR
jgi:hypothetical protein